MKVFIMTLGELNYESIFIDRDMHYPTSMNILFVLFCLGMPIILMNMLVRNCFTSNYLIQHNLLVFLKGNWMNSDYIEKLNIEKTLKKRFDTVVADEILRGMVWRRLRYSELKYGSVLRNPYIYLGNLCLAKFFFFYSSQKPHSNHFFPRFNHCCIITYIINNRCHHILSRRSNLVDSLRNINLFWTARLTA